MSKFVRQTIQDLLKTPKGVKYSKLSEESKSKFKEDLKVLEMLLNFKNQFPREVKFPHDKVDEKFRSMVRKYKGRKKALRACKTKSFRIPIDQKTVGYFTDLELLNNLNTYNYSSTVVREINMDRGLHYVVSPSQSRTDTVYSSHLVQRILERGGKEFKPEEAFRVLTAMMWNSKGLTVESVPDFEGVGFTIETVVRFWTKGGLVLGNVYRDGGRHILYFRTFVSMDMLHSKQLEEYSKYYKEGVSNEV